MEPVVPFLSTYKIKFIDNTFINRNLQMNEIKGDVVRIKYPLIKMTVSF
jgi:hypothetical protein